MNVTNAVPRANFVWVGDLLLILSSSFLIFLLILLFFFLLLFSVKFSSSAFFFFFSFYLRAFKPGARDVLYLNASDYTATHTVE